MILKALLDFGRAFLLASISSPGGFFEKMLTKKLATSK
jgi:hypothetical protein